MTSSDGPRLFSGIMVSSTFTDLEDHRAQLLKAIRGLGFMSIGMEDVGARADLDVIDSSLKMVSDSSAYIGVISHKYGQTPVCPVRNSDELSITELEYNEAIRLNLPVLIFIMSERHPLTIMDVEPDPEKRKKLASFRDRVKVMREGSEVHRIYDVFDNLADFSIKAARAIGRLSEFLKTAGLRDNQASVEGEAEECILPRAPALCALPKYLGSHAFLGRQAELRALDDWSAASDPNPMLLFEAIGGSGKSILTWHWANNGAAQARGDWKGRFWFSFYERGAVMADFCRHALAYMKNKPARDYNRKSPQELAELLIRELEQQPWLLVLDGLERVLVAYHRLDAPHMLDEEANEPIDQIATRDPRSAIRPDDDDLLRRFAAAAPSKILITSRLIPAAIVNKSGKLVPGVLHKPLSGLDSRDAEALFRSCGVFGNSSIIQTYLKTHCGFHPLVIGVLAGLVNDYLPDRGHFDLWAADSSYGARLNLARIDLAQKRNHILAAALDALAPAGRQVLQTLALLQGDAEFEVLRHFNPHLPLKPEPVKDPIRPDVYWFWDDLDDNEKETEMAIYQRSLIEKRIYVERYREWNIVAPVAPDLFGQTIRDLERRGLLQYDGTDKRYNLHPVVRGVTAGRMAEDETEKQGMEVIDYFSSVSPSNWVNPSTLKDVDGGLQIIYTLIRLGRLKEAWRIYKDNNLGHSLYYNLDAKSECEAILKAFFPDGWENEPVEFLRYDSNVIYNWVAITSKDLNLCKNMIDRAIVKCIQKKELQTLATYIHNTIIIMSYFGSSVSARLTRLSLDISNRRHEKMGKFISLLDNFSNYLRNGMRDEAEENLRYLEFVWKYIDPSSTFSLDAEYFRAEYLFEHDLLTDAELTRIEKLARDHRMHFGIRRILVLRGRWQMLRLEPKQALSSLVEAVRMAREVGTHNFRAEAILALARFRAGELFDARAEAERLSDRTRDLAVAELWRELGAPEKAIAHAVRCHAWAVGEGEPYVRRYELRRARELLLELGAGLPDVPRFDSSTVEFFPWEEELKSLLKNRSPPPPFF